MKCQYADGKLRLANGCTYGLILKLNSKVDNIQQNLHKMLSLINLGSHFRKLGLKLAVVYSRWLQVITVYSDSSNLNIF